MASERYMPGVGAGERIAELDAEAMFEVSSDFLDLGNWKAKTGTAGVAYGTLNIRGASGLGKAAQQIFVFDDARRSPAVGVAVLTTSSAAALAAATPESSGNAHAELGMVTASNSSVRGALQIGHGRISMVSRLRMMSGTVVNPVLDDFNFTASLTGMRATCGLLRFHAEATSPSPYEVALCWIYSGGTTWSVMCAGSKFDLDLGDIVTSVQIFPTSLSVTDWRTLRVEIDAKATQASFYADDALVKKVTKAEMGAAWPTHSYNNGNLNIEYRMNPSIGIRDIRSAGVTASVGALEVDFATFRYYIDRRTR